MNKVKLMFLSIMLMSISFLSYSFSAFLSVENPNSSLYYSCLFDVEIFVNTQNSDLMGIMGASIDFVLSSGLQLEGVSFGDTFNLKYPFLYDTGLNKYTIFGYKFPGVFTGREKFVTLRLSQNDNLSFNKINFVFDEKNIASENQWTSIFYLGGKSALTEIKNIDLRFSDGVCPNSLVPLTGNIVDISQEDLMHKASAIIDQYINAQKQLSSGHSYSIYYYIVIGLVFLGLVVLFVYKIFVHRRKKLS